MVENPDRKNPVTKDLAPSPGDLRIVKRKFAMGNETPGGTRILQRYEWSFTDKKHDWYDVPFVRED